MRYPPRGSNDRETREPNIDPPTFPVSYFRMKSGTRPPHDPGAAGRLRIRQRTAVTIAVLLILVAEVAHAQMGTGRFRIDGQAVLSKKGTPVYSGYIYNDGGGGAANRRLLIETLDAEGKVIGQVQGQRSAACSAATVSTSKFRSTPRARAIECVCCRGIPSAPGNDASGRRRPTIQRSSWTIAVSRAIC